MMRHEIRKIREFHVPHSIKDERYLLQLGYTDWPQIKLLSKRHRAVSF